MENLFVSYELALLAKEKGFNEPCDALYNDIDNLLIEGLWNTKNSIIDTITNNKQIVCAAPLYQQIIDWFRDKHNIIIEVNVDISVKWKNKYYNYKIIKFDNIVNSIIFQSNTNEYCEEYYKCLNTAIEESFKLI